MTEEYEEWSVWRDYTKMKIGVQKEGREAVYLTPEEAREKDKQFKAMINEHGLHPDKETINFHEKLLEYADELEEKRNNQN